MENNMYLPVVDGSLCDGCSLCVELCPAMVFSLEGGVAVADAGKCVGCGLCVPLCPREAISLVIDP